MPETGRVRDDGKVFFPSEGEEAMDKIAGTIFVVDDEPLIRKTLALTLRRAGFFVEVFASGQELLGHLPFKGVSCVITDLHMPDMDGMKLQEKLASASIRIPLIFMTGQGDIRTCVKALHKGAVDFLLKPFDRKEFLAVVRLALEKDRETRQKEAEIKIAKDKANSLTHREREVMARVVSGQANKHIAFDLGISEATVKVHRGRVMEKMGVQSVAELVQAAECAVRKL